jgi:hypothetical protein
VLLRKSWARGVVEVSLGASGGVAVVSREYVFLFRFGGAPVSLVFEVLGLLIRELSWLVNEEVVFEDISLSPLRRFGRWKP